nr:hypothetical protein A5881_002970 [Enterococcus termitis]
MNEIQKGLIPVSYTHLDVYVLYVYVRFSKNHFMALFR